MSNDKVEATFYDPPWTDEDFPAALRAAREAGWREGYAAAIEVQVQLDENELTE